MRKSHSRSDVCYQTQHPLRQRRTRQAKPQPQPQIDQEKETNLCNVMTTTPRRRPSTPLSSFMSDVLHTNEYCDVTLVADGSPTHIPSTPTPSPRRIRTTRQIYVHDDMGSRYIYEDTDDRKLGSSWAESKRRLGTDYSTPDHKRIGLASSNNNSCHPCHRTTMATISYNGTNDAHVIERWKNGIDSPKAKMRSNFKRVFRLSSFDQVGGQHRPDQPPMEDTSHIYDQSTPSLSSLSASVQNSSPNRSSESSTSLSFRSSPTSRRVFPKETWCPMILPLDLETDVELDK